MTTTSSFLRSGELLGSEASCGRTLPATWHTPLHTQILSAYDPGFARKSITVQEVGRICLLPSEYIVWH